MFPPTRPNKLVKIGEEEILSGILVWCVWDLQYPETCPGDEILEVVQEGLACEYVHRVSGNRESRRGCLLGSIPAPSR